MKEAINAFAFECANKRDALEDAQQAELSVLLERAVDMSSDEYDEARLAMIERHKEETNELMKEIENIKGITTDNVNIEMDSKFAADKSSP